MAPPCKILPQSLDPHTMNKCEDDIVVRFVIPTGKTEITVSDVLHRAYELCKKTSLACTWTKEAEVIRSIPREIDVFVMDPFSGSGFSHVTDRRHQCTVLGPRVMITCLETSCPVPQVSHPIFTLAMMGLTITSSGLDHESKERLEDLVGKMGGDYSSAFHDGITHLVAASVASRKYEVAVEREVPVMTEAWVEAVWEASQVDNVKAVHPKFSAYRCPALQGVTVSVSQLTKEDRDILKESVEQHGGRYSGALEMNKTTVLICAKPSGDKFDAASRWKIPCLASHWVYDSIEKGQSLAYDEYLVEDRDLDSSQPIPAWYGIYLPSSEAGMAGLSIKDDSESKYDSTATLNSTKSFMSGNSSANATVNSTGNATDSTINDTIISTGNATDSLIHHRQRIHSIPKSTSGSLHSSANATLNSSKSATMNAMNSTRNATMNSTRNATMNSTKNSSMNSTIDASQTEEYLKKTNLLLESLDITLVKRAGTFLDGCKVFLSGFSERQIGQLRRVLKFAGATWLSALAESVTHVVHGVARHVDPATSRGIQELDLSPHNVSLDWLVASMHSGRPASETDHSFPPPPEDEGTDNSSCDDTAKEEESRQFEDSLMAQYGSTSLRVI